MFSLIGSLLRILKTDGSFEHIPNLICVQQLCSKCEVVDDLNVDLNSVVSVPTCFGRKST